MNIAVGIFALLAIGAIGAGVLIKVVKKRQLTDIIMLAALGALALGYLLYMIAGKKAGPIAGGVLWILGWPGLAVGTYWPRIASLLLKAKAQAAAAPAAPALEALAPEAQAAQQPAEPPPPAEAPAEEQAPAEDEPAES